MAFVNYTLENQELTEMRLRDRSGEEFALGGDSPNKKIKNIKKYPCPFCHRQFNSQAKMHEHFKEFHDASGFSFFTLNNRFIKDDEKYEKYDILSAYNLDGLTTKYTISSKFSETLSFILSGEENYKDLSFLLKRNRFDIYTLSLERDGEKEQYELTPFIDIKKIKFEDIVDLKYPSILLYSYINKFRTVKELLTFANILVCEDDSEMFQGVWAEVYSRIQDGRIKSDDKDLLEFFIVSNLFCGCEIPIILGDKTRKSFEILKSIMNNEKQDYRLFINEIKKPDSLFTKQVLLLLSYLINDEGLIDFYSREVFDKGILGRLCHLLKVSITDCIFNKEELIDYKYLSHFRANKLVGYVCNVKESFCDNAVLETATYEFFNKMSKNICNLRISQEENPAIRSKLEKAVNKRFKNKLSADDLIWNRIESRNSLLKYPIDCSLLNNIKSKDSISVTQLGNTKAGCGNCFIVSYLGYSFMFDCGLNVQSTDNPIPNFALFEKPIDAIFISHAHLDHSGAIAIAHLYWPDAPIYTTSATKSYLEPFLFDISSTEDVDDFEPGRKINRNIAEDVFQSITCLDVDVHQRLNKNSEIWVQFHNAGHMLGAVMIEIHIKDKVILYTGDFSPYDQNLSSQIKHSKLPRNPDLLICEATLLSKNNHDSDWLYQMECLKNKISNNVHNKIILIPSNAIGKCQELLCIIFEMLREDRIPVHTRILVGGFAAKTTVAAFKHIDDEQMTRFYKSIEILEENEEFSSPTIIIGSSASLTHNSFSFSVLKMLADRYPHKDYSLLAAGTISKEASKLLKGKQVDYYSLNSHVTSKELERFVDEISPKVLILTHWGTSDQGERDGKMNEFYTKYNGRMVIFDIANHGTMSMSNILMELVERMPLCTQ